MADKRSKGLLSDSERQFAAAVAAVAYSNPFLHERIDGEREALGADYIATDEPWNIHGERLEEMPNTAAIVERSEALARSVIDRVRAGVDASDSDLELYEDAAVFLLYHRHSLAFGDLSLLTTPESIAKGASGLYSRFVQDADTLLNLPGRPLPALDELPHLFSAFFQLRRAFTHIFRQLIGASEPMARFRAAIWQSIFTHDMRRYRRVLFDRMGDFATLITGPTGTGKELAARAIAFSRYIPFDPDSGRFRDDITAAFHPLNLSALSPTLIESELFGHKRGAFTGAIGDRAGWLEVCPASGTVFLDEIGELDPSIQVKLLRVLQDRAFQRIGDVKDLEFRGKIIAATNRDLGKERREGRFRDDLYYRLCSDLIVAPSLREQLSDRPGELRRLIEFLLSGLLGEYEESLVDDIEACVLESLGPGYAWPGNVRELEQCVRNILIRGGYEPISGEPRDAVGKLAEQIRGTTLTADELLEHYCSLMYARTGSYEEAGRRLGLDRRTVKAKVNRGLVDEYAGGLPGSK